MKSRLLLPFLTILFVFPVLSLGQAKAVTKKVFDAAVDAAHAKTEKKIRIETVFEKRYEDGALKTTVNLTQEYLPPAKSRWIYLETTGNTVERTEIIYIGASEYRRINEGAWVKNGSESREIILDVGADQSVTKYFFEEIKEGAETYQVYSSSTVNRLDENETFFSEYKVWIKNGLLYKKTDETSTNTRENVESTSVTTYDYSPKPFKIVAPVLAKKKKS
jgi:hypothetical protein